MENKERAARNRTLTLKQEELPFLKEKIISLGRLESLHKDN